DSDGTFIRQMTGEEAERLWAEAQRAQGERPAVWRTNIYTLISIWQHVTPFISDTGLFSRVTVWTADFRVVCGGAAGRLHFLRANAALRQLWQAWLDQTAES
ncbi:MAG: hypothetical protein D6711_10150, partial [Chloroflexi bacterium]